MENIPVTTIQKAVLDWYALNGRHDLPWRNMQKKGVDVPYGVMVAEIMLQQTQVERVIPKYNAWLNAFPTVQSLADAPLSQIISFWSGLGYNRRAVMLHRAAQEIVEHFNGELPRDPKILCTLPGIGSYTSCAIAAFGFNLSCVVLDTNIERFYELLIFGYDKPSLQEVHALAQKFVPDNKSCDWHSALMDLMTQIRTFRLPIDQQQQLLKVLNLTPTWKLPELNDALLYRPKQSTFRGSKRFYRGKIIAYLKDQPSHTAKLSELENLLKMQKLPVAYSYIQILETLKRDGLIDYLDPLKSNTVIALP